jgi:hypothetical protein
MITSPSNFQTNQTNKSRAKSIKKKNFELDLVYDLEKLNETNLVSSNNVTSRELSMKKIQNRKLYIENGRQRNSHVNRRILKNQTSMDPHLGLNKSPKFPEKRFSKNPSSKKIETIPFDVSKPNYKTPNSNSNLSYNSNNQNTKTIKNLVIDMPRNKSKSVRRGSKRAKSRPVSRGSNYAGDRASVNLITQKQFKEMYNKHHRSFQKKKKKKKLEFGYGRRKRALSSKEILFGSGVNKGTNVKYLAGLNDIYQGSGQHDQVGLIYVDKNFQVFYFFFG